MDDCTRSKPFTWNYLTLAIENGAAFFIVYHASNALDRREKKRNPHELQRQHMKCNHTTAHRMTNVSMNKQLTSLHFHTHFLQCIFCFSSQIITIYGSTKSLQCIIKRNRWRERGRERKTNRTHIECMALVWAWVWHFVRMRYRHLFTCFTASISHFSGNLLDWTLNSTRKMRMINYFFFKFWAMMEPISPFWYIHSVIVLKLISKCLCWYFSIKPFRLLRTCLMNHIIHCLFLHSQVLETFCIM